MFKNVIFVCVYCDLYNIFLIDLAVIGLMPGLQNSVDRKRDVQIINEAFAGIII
jgi:hypothetical protein